MCSLLEGTVVPIPRLPFEASLIFSPLATDVTVPNLKEWFLDKASEYLQQNQGQVSIEFSRETIAGPPSADEDKDSSIGDND